ncbi:uncharacterized protein LOC110063312 [Orbicella faveolata]|uniref:uncharacterized protein LOC110063312 n=1 Tax=Orbicella faveolata TaxID=48498 RepID=UPI0009E5B054|nr:uncharacterized protein LOC110063312 [Orbicella faveolata]
MNSVKSTGNILPSVLFSPREAESARLWTIMKENTVVFIFLILALFNMASYSRSSPLYQREENSKLLVARRMMLSEDPEFGESQRTMKRPCLTESGLMCELSPRI